MTTTSLNLLGVRSAAKQLGVHENTLRRWQENGLVKAIRLPSGVRRFHAEDIEQLRRQMYNAGESHDRAIAAAAGDLRAESHDHAIRIDDPQFT